MGVRLASDERGYLMVALLVAMSIMAIMMGAAMPAWHTMVQREKEAELVFRGEQYARAIGLYQRRFANAPAPSLDLLVAQRFLRKKYKDPITNDDFEPLTLGTPLPGQTQPGAQSASGTRTGSAQTSFEQALGRGRGTVATPQGGRAGAVGGVVGGVVGVRSKSELKSLRLYNGRGSYHEWIFMPVAQTAQAGGPPGAVGRGGRGADGRGGRGADGRGGRGADGRGGIFDGRGTPPAPAQPPGRGRF